MVIVTGMATGQESTAGTLDDGQPWTKRVLVILEGTRTREIRLDKGWQGPIPVPGQFVAVECSFGYGNKLHGVRALSEEVAKAIDSASAPAKAS